MRSKLIFLILIIAFGIYSCSVAQMNSKDSSEPEAAARLFSTAENFFQSNSYENALGAYQEFLNSYPSDANAVIALMKIATIYSKQGKYDLSLMAYQRLTAEYPHSKFSIDAMVEILIALYKQGKFKKVILLASEIIEKTDSKPHLFRTYVILGDTYVSLDFPRDAIFFYRFAYQNAGSQEEKNCLLKLESVVSRLSSEDTLSLLMRLEDEFLRSHLLYHLGVKRYEKQDYKEASKIFSEFVESFPEHEKAKQAKNLIEEINQKFAFKPRLVGCLLPLSGLYETFGIRALRGIQFALDQFNSQSNQSGFEMIIKDTGSEPEIAMQSLRQLDQSGVSLIIGPIVTSEYVSQGAQIRGLPIITLTQKPGIPQLGDYVFRIFLTPGMQIDAIVPYVIDQLGLKRFAILYPHDHYGETFMELFRDKVLDYGATVSAIESYEPEETDFALQIKKLSRTFNNRVVNYRQQDSFRGKNRHIKTEVIIDFDAIFIPDIPEKIALIAPQLTFYDIDNVLLLGTNLWHSDKLIQMAGEYVQEAIMADVFCEEDSKKSVKEFMMSFEKFYGQSPGFIEALAYDAAMIALQVASSPRVESRKDLKDELQNLRNFEGATGLTSFNENGDAVKKLYLLQVVDDKFVELSSN